MDSDVSQTSYGIPAVSAARERAVPGSANSRAEQSGAGPESLCAEIKKCKSFDAAEEWQFCAKF